MAACKYPFAHNDNKKPDPPDGDPAAAIKQEASKKRSVVRSRVLYGTGRSLGNLINDGLSFLIQRISGYKLIDLYTGVLPGKLMSGRARVTHNSRSMLRLGMR